MSEDMTVVLKASDVRTRGWVINYYMTMGISYEIERLDQPTYGVVCLPKTASWRICPFPRRNMSIQHALQCNKSVIEQTMNMPCIICSFPCCARDVSALYCAVAREDACSAILTGYISLVVALQQLKLEYHENTPLQRWKQQVLSKRQLNDLVSPSGLS